MGGFESYFFANESLELYFVISCSVIVFFFVFLAM